MLNSRGDVFPGSLETTQTAPCEIPHMDCGVVSDEERAGSVMSSCSGVVIFRPGVGRVCVATSDFQLI